MSLTRAERELHIYFNEEEGVFRASCDIPRFQRKLSRLGWKLDKETNEWVGSATSVKLGRPTTRKRNLTPEQRAAASARLKAVRANSQTPPS